MEETTEIESESVVERADPELDRLASENEELKKEIRMRAAAYEVEAKLAMAGARTPGLLADKAKEAFQFDEDGKLANPEALVESLRRSYPEQFGRDVRVGSIDAGAGRNASPPLTRDALSRMSVAEIQRLDWDEVRDVLASK